MNFLNLSKKPLQVKMMIVTSFACVGLFVLGFLTFFALLYLSNTAKWVNHTNEVIKKALELEGSAVDMETGMRGYLLAGKDSFLEPYHGGKERFANQIEDLKRTVSNNPEQVRRLSKIQKTIEEWQENVTESNIELRSKISSGKSMNHMARLVQKKEGKIYFDQFRALIGRFIANEQALLVDRQEKAEKSTSVKELRKNIAEVNHSYKVINRANEILLAAVNMETGMRGFLLAGQDEFLEPYNDGKEKIESYISQLQQTVSDNPTQVSLLGDSQQVINDWDNNVAWNLILLRAEIGDSKTMDDMATLVSKAKGKAYFDAFRKHLADFIDLEKSLMLTRQSRADTANLVTNLVVIFGVIATILLTLMGSANFSRTIVTQIQSYIEKIGLNSHSVASSSSELANSSSELSKFTVDQAASIDETASRMDHINSTVRNNLEFAEESSSLSGEVCEKMKEMEEAIHKIDESNERINGLVEIIAQIGRKTKVIDEIVFQTKLLSFNASIEAERAGDHGRGFAIVAQEIAKLAQMSGDAALEISGIVKTSTSSTDSLLRENSQRVQEGNSKVKETLHLSDSVASSSNKIVKKSIEQSSGIDEIRREVENMKINLQKTSTIAENTDAASSDLQKQATSLNQSLIKLKSFLDGGEAA